MEFIYDILLNFQLEYCDFFEWQLSDKIINVKKVPLYKVNNQDFLNFKYHDITLIENTFPKKYQIILVTNGLEVLGILINKNNKIIKRSSLILEEATDILESLPKLKITPIKYQKKLSRPINYQGRIYQEKHRFIEQFLSNLHFENDEYLLKYLYFDLYNIEENNLKKIYQNLLELKKNNYQQLYDSITSITKNK